MARHTKYLILLLTALLLTSCIRDESSVADIVLPGLHVEGAGSDELPVVNVDLGQPCIINPRIDYQADAASLVCKWSIGTYANGVKGKLKEVSHDRIFSYTFESGGTYYVHLVVTDGRQGVVSEWQVNVNRIFEEGYLLTANDTDGHGNLTFVKVMTPEEVQAGRPQVIVEHALEYVNGLQDVPELLNAVTGQITWPKVLTRVLVSLPDRCYFLDPNTFTAISEISYTEFLPGFHATHFVQDGYYSFAYDSRMKRYVHLDMQYMFPFEYQFYKGMPFEDFITSEFSFSGSLYSKLFFADYSASRVSEFNMYAAYSGSSNFPSTGDLLTGRKVLTVFSGANVNPSTGIAPEYIMVENGRRVELYTNAEQSYMGEKTFEMQTLVNRGSIAVPAQGTRFVASPRYNRHFYAVGSNVYVFLAGNTFSLPETDAPAISFSEDEEVTFMRVNMATEELYVGTYDNRAQRGSFYIFQTSDVRADNTASPKPVAAFRHCTGRISNIIYKPSITN